MRKLLIKILLASLIKLGWTPDIKELPLPIEKLHDARERAIIIAEETERSRMSYYTKEWKSIEILSKLLREFPTVPRFELKRIMEDVI